MYLRKRQKREKQMSLYWQNRSKMLQLKVVRKFMQLIGNTIGKANVNSTLAGTRFYV